MDYLQAAQRVISDEVKEIERMLGRLDDAFCGAVDLLKDRLERQGKIVIVGVGKSGNVGAKLAATFSSTGAPAAVLNCQDALHGDLGLVTADDVVIALSYSGATRELMDLMPHLKRIGASTIAITGKMDSSLAKHADVALDVGVEREACPLNLAPTSSTTNTLVMGDALAMVLLEVRGFKKEDFARLHPGGSLGHALLTKASEIMRQGDDLVLVQRDESVTSAVGKMTKARAGAVVVADEAGILLG
ncbi:MAG: KpsF/GutQ family sugar-phosphate isomerase, partial [Verrucomicrobiota bacterium]